MTDQFLAQGSDSRLKRLYSLRSPFGPHRTTCVTPLRSVPTAASN